MKFSRKTLIFVIFVAFLTISNVILLILAINLFPSYGGFTRQIIFIKPNEESEGYFIILDELEPESQEYDIDWILHSRGEIDIDSDDEAFTCTTPSYISNDDVSVEISFLESVNDINEEEGYFLPTHYDDDYPHDDLKTPYIRATYSGSSNPIMATVLAPKNDSDTSQEFPDIKIKSSGLRKIGDNDYLFYSVEEDKQEFSDPDIEFEGTTFFLRRNSTEPDKLLYFYLQDAESLEYESLDYFESYLDVKNILATYANNSQVSGCIKMDKIALNEISLFCPFTAQMVKLDGVNTTFSQSDSIVSFPITESCSFVISSTNNYSSSEYDPLRDSAPDRDKAKESEWEFDKDLIDDLDHPYTIYDSTDLLSIRNKLLDPAKNWSDWYESYVSNVDDIDDPDDYDKEERHYYLYRLVLKYVIEGGSQYLDVIKDFLKEMGKVTSYSQDLRRAYAVQSYATVLDMVYNDLSSSEKDDFKDYLFEQAHPLMWMDLYPENNHRVVDAGALGMAGLMLKNKTMINTAIDTILTYYYKFNPADGGSYEGYSYNAFAMDEFMQFAVSLKRLGAYNFFNDPQIVATFEFMAETLGPLGMPSLFEDCTFSSRLQEVILIGAANMNDNYPTKAQNFQYIWEQRQNNSLYDDLSDDYYSYLDGGSPTFNRIMLYNVNTSITAEPFSSRKEIWKESGMAFLRSEDSPDGLFLSFNCKDYGQSHVHYDENSFELWAFGAYIIHNPGYPGFGVKHHDYSIDTEGSNTLLISGSGQLQETADGLKASISSPYFSMVIGEAEEIYNDLGSYEYFQELYLLIIINFIFLGVVCFLFYKIKKQEGDPEPNEQEEPLDRLELSKSKLVGISLTNPIRAIEYIYLSDPFKDKANFLNRFIKYLIAGLMALFFLLLILKMKPVVDYHLTYYEEKAAGVFDAIKIIVLAFVIVGPILTFLFSLAALKIYSRVNKSLVYNSLEGERIDLTKKNLNFISSLSTVSLIPTLLIAFLLYYVSFADSFIETIDRVTVGSGSIVYIYYEVLLLTQIFIQNAFLIILFSIPFLLLTIKIFSEGIYRNSEGRISKSKGACISLASILILLVIFFLTLITYIILLKIGLSYVSIESSIDT